MEIYAELTRKQLIKIESGEMKFVLPSELSMIRRNGSRACFFETEDDYQLEQFKNNLDNLGINWQDNN